MYICLWLVLTFAYLYISLWNKQFSLMTVMYLWINSLSIYLSIYTLHQPPASDMYWQNIIKLIMIITFTFSIVNCTKEKKNFLSKSNIKSPLHLTRKSISFDFSLWRKKDKICTHHFSKWTNNSHNFYTYIWVYFTKTFLAISNWTKVNLWRFIVNGGE